MLCLRQQNALFGHCLCCFVLKPWCVTEIFIGNEGIGTIQNYSRRTMFPQHRGDSACLATAIWGIDNEICFIYEPLQMLLQTPLSFLSVLNVRTN